MSNECCGDNRFEVIDRAKEALLKSTNIETSEKEMEVLDSFLFRCWQMGWLKKYDDISEEEWNTICNMFNPYENSIDEYNAHMDFREGFKLGYEKGIKGV